MPLALRKPPKQQTSTVVPVPAPVGGMNAISPPSAVGSGETLLQYNMMPGEYGLRSRLGYSAPAPVFSVPGSDAQTCTMPMIDGSTVYTAVCGDRGAVGISVWNGASWGTKQLMVGATDGMWVSLRNDADSWTIFCRRTGGYYLGRGSDQAWFKVESTSSISASAWTNGHGYVQGEYVTNGAYTYICTITGTSAGSGGPTGMGEAITDNTCTWKWVPILNTTADPDNFCHAVVWKNRLWFADRTSSNGYYLDLRAVFGTCTAFDFGSKFKNGGEIHSLWNWTRDGGDGIDDALIVLSQHGNLVMYEGTDPTIPGAFIHRGSWAIGSLFGTGSQQIAVNFGGDLLIMGMDGIYSMSAMAAGSDPALAATAIGMKVQPIVSMAYPSEALGRWFCFHNTVDGYLGFKFGSFATLAMHAATRTWFRLRDIDPTDPGYCINGQWMFCGTVPSVSSETVALCTQSGQTFTDDGTPIDCSVVTGYSPAGRVKRVHGIRPYVSEVDQTSYNTDTYACNSISVSALFDGVVQEAAAPSYTAPTLLSSSAVTYQPTRSMLGTTGAGFQFAIAIRMAATYRLVLQGFDVLAEEGRGVL